MITVTIGGGIAPVILLVALDRTTDSTVSLLLNLELVATAIVARLLFREDIGKRPATGIGLVLLGGWCLSRA